MKLMKSMTSTKLRTPFSSVYVQQYFVAFFFSCFSPRSLQVFRILCIQKFVFFVSSTVSLIKPIQGKDVRNIRYIK